MKFSILFRSLIAAAFLCLLTIPAAAQYLGPGIGSYTFIDYDEDTNTVTTYSQTDTDYDVMGDYQAYVSLTVRNDYGTAVAIGTATDDYGDGFAAVELSFAGAAGATYTATGVHRGIATLYDYDYDPPYNRIFYFDNWYFTPFEAQNVYEPWQYFFTSPGYTYHTRRTERINLGSTYESASTTVAPTTCLLTYNKLYAQAKDYGGNYGKVNEVTSIATAWARLKSATDANVINPDSQVKDSKNNIYQKYNQTSTIPNKTLVGTISISSGPDSEKKLRFTKP